MARPSDPLAVGVVTPGPDESAAILRGHLEAREPFVYTKIGDGVVCSIYGCTAYGRGDAPDANGIYLNQAQGQRIFEGLRMIRDWSPRPYFGALPEGLDTEWADLQARLADPPLLSAHAVEHDRISEELVRFYVAVADDPRKKLYISPATLKEGARMLRANWHDFPLGQEAQDDWPAQRVLAAWIEAQGYWDVVLLSCAHAAKVIGGFLAERDSNITVIDLGSALDPIFGPPTRSGQADRYRLTRVYSAAGLLAPEHLSALPPRVPAR